MIETLHYLATLTVSSEEVKEQADAMDEQLHESASEIEYGISPAAVWASDCMNLIGLADCKTVEEGSDPGSPWYGGCEFETPMESCKENAGRGTTIHFRHRFIAESTETQRVFKELYPVRGQEKSGKRKIRSSVERSAGGQWSDSCKASMWEIFSNIPQTVYLN